MKLKSDIGGRSERVDLLRGLAILAVLLLHFSLTYSLISSPLAAVFPADWLRALFLNGNYGVTIFFVISGYLITSNSLKRYAELGRTSLRSFYTLRAARILPPLLLVLLIIVPLGCLGLPSFRNEHAGVPLPASLFVLGVLSVLTFWHNVLMESVGYFNYGMNIFWSLSVEEVFYLAFPLVCVTLRRDFLIALVCLALIAVAPMYRSAHADNDLYYMYGYLACFDAIALGCLTAMLRARVPAPPSLRLPLTVFGSLLLAVSYLYGISGHEVWGFSVVALSTACLLFSDSPSDSLSDARRMPRISQSWALPLAPLRWLGRHSYELYLFHIVILAAMRNFVPRGQLDAVWKLPALLAFIPVSALAAHIVARYFAEPLNRTLRSRYGVGEAIRVRLPAAGTAAPNPTAADI